MRQRALVAAHCLVSITKVRGGLLWLLLAWSMALKCAEHYLLKCAEGSCGCSLLVNGTKGRGALLTKVRGGLVAPICLVNSTKGRGGPLRLLIVECSLLFP